MDWYAFTVSFKSVLLEGLEVVFIVLTFGAVEGTLAPALLGAALAVLIVGAGGVALRTPLSRVPENALKFVVGAMLTTFGLFWSVEGMVSTGPWKTERLRSFCCLCWPAR